MKERLWAFALRLYFRVRGRFDFFETPQTLMGFGFIVGHAGLSIRINPKPCSKTITDARLYPNLYGFRFSIGGLTL